MENEIGVYWVLGVMIYCLIGVLFALGAALDGEFERARAAFLFWPVYAVLYALLGLKTLCGDVVDLLSELFFEN